MDRGVSTITENHRGDEVLRGFQTAPEFNFQPQVEKASTNETFLITTLQQLLPPPTTIKFLTTEEQLRDDAGAVIPSKILIKTPYVHEAAQAAKALNLGIIMAGARTSATKNFGTEKDAAAAKDRKIPDYLSNLVIIEPAQLTSIDDHSLAETPAENYEALNSSHVKINHDKLGKGRHTITVGAGLTFGQVNKILKNELGAKFYLPVDLTTIDQALAGAVFATGALGPSRLPLTQILRSVTITDGDEIRTLTGEEIQDHNGLIGLTGAVISMELEVIEKPTHKFGVSINLNTDAENPWPLRAAEVLTSLTEFTRLKIVDGKISSNKPGIIVDGSEIITMDSLQRILAANGDKDIARLTKALSQDLEDKDFTIYITGFNEHGGTPTEIEEILTTLLERGSITGFREHGGKDHGGTKQLETMRGIRELGPALAREEGRVKASGEDLRTSLSTDINSRINPDILSTLNTEEITALTRMRLEPYFHFENEILALAERAKSLGVTVKLNRYGHLQEAGIDPHMRVNTIAEIGNEEAFAAINEEIQRLNKALIAAVKSLPEQDDRIEIHHGEKGQIHYLNMLTAERRNRIHQAISATPKNWTFRMPTAARMAA